MLKRAAEAIRHARSNDTVVLAKAALMAAIRNEIDLLGIAPRSAGQAACSAFLILDPFEHIVRVSGRYGNTVDSLYIQTSNSQFRTFGVKDSNAPGTFDFIAPEGTAITALVIRACTFVDAVGVVLRPLVR
jgi:hypothetical protein